MPERDACESQDVKDMSEMRILLSAAAMCERERKDGRCLCGVEWKVNR